MRGELRMNEYPLMSNNINQDDIEVLVDFLKNNDHFTNGQKVREFEKQWSDWLGRKYSVFVNSGSSANYISLCLIKELYGEGEVILSPLGWESDVASVLMAGFKPVFVDVNLDNLSLNVEQVLDSINENTKAVLMTHVLGYDGMSDEVAKVCKEKKIVLLEDTCESHGATHDGQKCGTFGDISNFSFYYAHHMSTIEGGMICTDSEEIYNYARMFRSHGMLRESDNLVYRRSIEEENPDLHPEFIFTVPGFNMRSTELNAVIGINQLKRLDSNIEKRTHNYNLFIKLIDSKYYYADFRNEGSSNYAFVLMPRKEFTERYEDIVNCLKNNSIEFRRGTAGGGNLAMQPFVKKRVKDIDYGKLKNVDFIHKYGFYIGNYPDLGEEKIANLCTALNGVFR